MALISTSYNQTKWENIWLFIVSFVEVMAVKLALIKNVLDLVACNKDISGLCGAKDTSFTEFEPHALHHTLPFIGRSPLSGMLNREVVWVYISVKSVDRKRVLEEHRERFSVVRQINVNFFICLLSQFPQVFLKLLWLSLFNTLRNFDQQLLELHFPHKNGLVLNVDDVQLLKTWVTRAWELAFW